MLLDADGSTLLAASSAELARSADCGSTWQSLPTSGMQVSWSAVGLVRGDSVLYGGFVGFHRSNGGGAFESAISSFPASLGSVALQSLARDGGTIYGLISDRLFAWKDLAHPRRVDLRLPIKLGKHSPEVDAQLITDFAVRGEHLLVLVRGKTGSRLYLSRNRGASWQDATHGAPLVSLTAVAACDAGFLLGTHGGGVWLLPD